MTSSMTPNKYSAQHAIRKNENLDKARHVLLGTQAGQGVGKTRFAAELGPYCASKWEATVRVVLRDFVWQRQSIDRNMLRKCGRTTSLTDGLSKLLGARINAVLQWGTSLERACTVTLCDSCGCFGGGTQEM